MADTVAVSPMLTWKIFFQVDGETKTASTYDRVTTQTKFDWDLIQRVAADDTNPSYLMARVLLAARDAVD